MRLLSQTETSTGSAAESPSTMADDAETATRQVHGNDASGLLAGLVCGVTMGAILGLLLAPRPGRESRAWVANRSRQVGRGVRSLLDVSAVHDIIRRRGLLGLREARRRGRDAKPVTSSVAGR